MSEKKLLKKIDKMLIFCIMIILLLIFGISIYHHNYPKISDDNLITYMEQSTLDDDKESGTSGEILDYFKEAGFTTIRVQPLPNNQLEGGQSSDRKLAYLKLGNDKLNRLEDYRAKLLHKRLPKDTPITLFYHDFPEGSLPLQVLFNSDAEELSKVAKLTGFSDVTLILDKSRKVQSESNIAKIFIKGEKLLPLYQSEEEEVRYFSKDVPIVIHYKEKAKKIEHSAIELTGLDDKTVVPFLEQLGFENIKIERVETDTHETGTLKDIVINGKNARGSIVSFWSIDPVIVEVWDRSAFDEKKRQEEEKKRQEEADRRNPSAYGSVSFDAWNHDEIPVGNRIAIRGKVLQNSSGLTARTLRVAIDNDYDKIVLVTISNSEYKSVLAEDDWVTIYGTNAGLTTYTTVLGAEKTLPGLKAVFYQRD